MDNNSTPSVEQELLEELRLIQEQRVEHERARVARIVAQRSASSAPPDDSTAPVPAK